MAQQNGAGFRQRDRERRTRSERRRPGPLARLDRIPVWPWERRLLWVVGAGYFFAFFDIVTISFAVPVIATQFHVSKSAVTAVGHQQPDRLHHRRVRRQHDRRQVRTAR